SARRLLQPEAAGFFMRDVAGPCPKAQSRGRWPFCTKSGNRIEADISAVDLNYDGCPARLLAVIPVIERLCVVAEQPLEPRKLETVNGPFCKVPRSVHLGAHFVESQASVVPHKAPALVSGLEPQRTLTEPSRPVVSSREVIPLRNRNSVPVEPPKTVA